MGQLGGIGVDEGILVLRARDAGADRDVLRRLHVNREAVEACQLRAQAADHLVGACGALALRLQSDEHLAFVERLRSARADLRADRGDRGILENDGERRLHFLFHRLKRDVVGRLRHGDDQPGVLLREEPLGDKDKEIAGEDDRPEHHQQRQEAMP